MQATKTIRHRKTLPPWECSRCHLISYGWMFERGIYPFEYTLCTKCCLALERYEWENYELFNLCGQIGEDDNVKKRIHELSLQWIKDSESNTRKYKNVPKWMKLAIEQGKVITNAKDVYIVTEQAETISVEIVQRSE